MATNAIESRSDVNHIHNAEDDSMTCFACNGTGIVSKKDMLKKLGGKELLDLLAVDEKKFFDMLNKNSPKFLETLKASIQGTYDKEKDHLKEQHRLELKQVNDKREDEIHKHADGLAELKQDIETLKQKNTELESKQKSVPSLIGQSGEIDFKEWISQYPQFECSEKLSDTGDYLVTLKVAEGNGDLVALKKPIVVDHKKNKKVTASDEEKIIRDAKLRSLDVAYLCVENREQFRGKDIRQRYKDSNDILVIIGTKEDFINDSTILPRFIELLCEHKDEEDYQEIAQKLKRVLITATDSFDAFKTIAKDIRRNADSIDEGVDGAKNNITKQMEKIVGKSLGE